MDLAPLFQSRIPGAGPRPAQTSQVRMLDGLSFKQAFATLIIALTVGLLTSAYELLNDYRNMHDQVRRDVGADLNLVRGLAVEAAYQLSAELAGEVVAGLHQNPVTLEVVLTDNYGGELGRQDRAAVSTPFPALAERLFGDVAAHARTLETRNPNGSSTVVGSLELRLDAGGLLNAWLDRATNAVLSGVARAVLVCALVVAVFYILITKPLLRITDAIGRVDPAHPGAFLIDLQRGHQRDELGLLVGTVNGMLAESQHGLDDRDRAQNELAALARDLERRVTERTQELAREKEGVERALAQLNLANTELEKANRDINDGIRYASRIQTALLPDQGALAGVVDELAVGWQPLDMVGGDYYWAGSFESKGVIAVMDCTGHGVPGAFMTAVVASSFSRILHHHGHEDPAEMLTQLNRLVKTALRQDRDSAVSNDGLDAAICVIDRAKATLTFAGANLPLLVAENGSLRQVRGDRMSLGYLDSPEDYRFAAHSMSITPGSAFYLYTDGVTDQVGGDNNRLFGRRRLQEVLAEMGDRPVTEQMDALFQRLGQWRGEQRRRDDMTFVAFRPLSGSRIPS
ncbi:SpoIIE family protein phosphatase [Magnetospirillum gryphiswaldense]|uniref:Stage II sporulation E n=1 Tax=Magnetospirillum gryphiswaldense TaxID=55518 RepID=A4TZM5_9PROT|nr:SpoIIE family protein phosphatase [Magnetospirillum gryphiswaldense]AVM75066.1 Stage II sporulation protein E (SpoIIE) [Magnetospirillum gryphiswaldense MSR-1]AVM78969.1 Stage II sporulation protein E (SpoIIE) [Magnetospirillum gryphiswaldense]CAM76082.1 Stage II sporulation E [Magnetospirillum gryphiswaldense MSR-1]